jgi:hypothetical protein
MDLKGILVLKAMMAQLDLKETLDLKVILVRKVI